jgi:hypothetical protein
MNLLIYFLKCAHLFPARVILCDTHFEPFFIPLLAINLLPLNFIFCCFTTFSIYVLFIYVLFYLNFAHLFLPLGPVLCETHVLSPLPFFGLSVILHRLFQSSLFPELSASLSGACPLISYALSLHIISPHL